MRILIIGSSHGTIVTEAGRIAVKNGSKVTTASDIDHAIHSLRSGKGADLVLIDIKMNIGRFIDTLRNERFTMPVIACGYKETTPEEASRAIDMGADEYLSLPPNPELIAAIFAKLTSDIKKPIYSSQSMEKVIKLADQVAGSHASVLITGESGTGKEVISQYIHQKSPRKQGNFIAINCAAIPESLLESELFGHEKGAFSGAVARRIGKFEEANEGTILLDEISEMDLRLQAKLLRVLQEKEITRVGSNEPIHVNVRVLATSNRNMAQSVKDGHFREDLFFRLNVINIQIPSLRERIDDIPILSKHFVKEYCADNHMSPKDMTPKALAKLSGYHWPGNVRELSNTIHRAVLLSGDKIDEDSIIFSDEHAILSKETEQPNAAGQVGKSIAEMERSLIIDTVKHYFGDHAYAAKILGISINELQEKLKQYKNEGFLP